MTIAQQIAALQFATAADVEDFVSTHAGRGYVIDEDYTADECGELLGLERGRGNARVCQYKLQKTVIAIVAEHNGRLICIDGWEGR